MSALAYLAIVAGMFAAALILLVWSLCRASAHADAVAQTRCGTDVSGVTDGKIAVTTKAVPSGAANASGDLTGAPPDITRKDHGYAGF